VVGGGLYARGAHAMTLWAWHMSAGKFHSILSITSRVLRSNSRTLRQPKNPNLTVTTCTNLTYSPHPTLTTTQRHTVKFRIYRAF
jgi:hypothetical protein